MGSDQVKSVPDLYQKISIRNNHIIPSSHRTDKQFNLILLINIRKLHPVQPALFFYNIFYELSFSFHKCLNLCGIGKKNRP